MEKVGSEKESCSITAAMPSVSLHDLGSLVDERAPYYSIGNDYLLSFYRQYFLVGVENCIIIKVILKA